MIRIGLLYLIAFDNFYAIKIPEYFVPWCAAILKIPEFSPKKKGIISVKIINKSALGFVVMIVALSSLFTKTLFDWSIGPPAYRTGAPGDEGACNADGCHNSFSLDSGSAKFSISGPSAYTPRETVRIEVSFSFLLIFRS